MTDILLLISLPLLVLCFLDWRKGMLVTVAAGFLQDPMRKMMEGEPVYMTVYVGLFFGASLLGALYKGMPLSLAPIYRSSPGVKAPLLLFLGLVSLQLVIGFLKTHSIFIAGIGFIGYFAPALALLTAFRFGVRGRDITRWLQVYVVLAGLMCVGIYLEVAGFDWSVLGSVGEGVFIYPKEGGVVKLPTGFFRSAENAAWHGAAAFCLIVVMVLSRSWRGSIWLAAAIGLSILGAVLLTGRRKAIMEIVMFLFLYGGLLALFQKGATKLAVFLALGGLLAGLGQAVFLPEEDQATYKPYVERTSTVVEEASGRLKLMTVDAVRWSIQQNGFFGAGAGLGGQGAQHFGGGATLVGGGAEGGLGRIMGELGVPGFLLFAWLVASFAIAAWQIMHRLGRARRGQHAMVEGFVAFLIANVIVFMTAAQIFGDPFVLLILGFLGGYILSAPAARYREQVLASRGKKARGYVPASIQPPAGAGSTGRGVR